MTNTTYYNLNIVEGTDIVNPLIVDNPNYEKIDVAMHDNAVAGVTLATEIANATVHSITRENSDCAVIRFIATSQWKAGDTATVDGVPVTALLPSGETLPDGAYVINANVLCILTGTNLTVYVEGKKTQNANDITYNDTTVGAELVKLDGEIVRLDGEIDNINSNLNVYNASSGYIDISSYTDNNKYVIPSDGYLYINSLSGTGYIYVCGSNGNVMCAIGCNTASSTMAFSLFVKKGMKAYCGNLNGNTYPRFIPFNETV